ncbi:hypothetical protein ACWEGE_04510 [Amycolatopsis sp. NPDC004747]
MLVDWYFCNAVGLTPSATHGFLDVLAALRNRTDEELVVVALDELEHAETSLLFYALRDIFAARRAFDGEAVQDRAAARLTEAAAAAGVRRTPAPPTASVPARVRNISSTSLRDKTGLGFNDRPYLDTAEFGAETVILSELADLCAETPGADVAIMAEPALATLLDRACRGSHGRLPLLLACRVLTRTQSERVARVLRRPQAGVLALEPDLLAALARARFGVGPETDLTAIAAEATDRRVLAADLADLPAVADRRLHEVRIRLGCLDSAPARLTAAVWQLTLAEITLLDGAPSDYRWLRDWLASPPAFGKAAPDPDEDGTAPEQPALDQPAQPTPWIYRRDSFWVAKPKKDAAGRRTQTRFPGCADPVRLLTLLGSALAAAELTVTDRPHPEDDTGLEFLLHTADVLADPLLRDTVTSLAKRQTQDVRPMSQQLAALAVHTYLRVGRIGACRDERIEPSRIVDLTISRMKAPPRNSEAGKLHDTAAAMLVTDWVFNAVSGSTGVSGSDGSNRWFEGERPPARQLLAWIVSALSARGSRAPVGRQKLLLAQLWPQEPLGTPSDWPSRLAERDAKIGAQELLLTPPLSVAEWEEHWDELAGRLPEDGAVSVAATERLAAVFAEPEWPAASVVEPWSADWIRHIDAVHSPRTFRRDLRRRLVQLFSLPAGHENAQRILRQTLEKVIDAIVEFSIDAPNDLWLLAKALVTPPSEGGAGPETLQLLRSRFLHVASALPPATATAYQLISPYQAHDAMEVQRVRSRIIEHVLFAVAGTSAKTSTGPALLGEIYRSTVEDLALEAQAVEKTVTLGRERPAWPDERWLSWVTMNHADQVVRCRLLDRATPEEHSGLVDLAALPVADRQRRLAELTAESTRTLGMVCAPPGLGTDGEPGVWVNVGTAEPLWVKTAAAWSLGDAVEVSLHREDAETPVTARSPRQLDMALRPDRIRAAVVRTGAAEHGKIPAVKIVDTGGRTIDGGLAKDAPRHRRVEWVRRWDPDTSAAFGESAEVRTLARWDADDRCWYPLDRTMAELVAALQASGAERVVTVVGTVGDGRERSWRLSTAPGVVYLVHREDWTESGHGELAGWSSVAGLRLRIRLTEERGRVRLAPAGPDAVDDRNLRWAGLFDEPETLVAELEDGMWRFFADVPGIGATSLAVTGLDDVSGVDRAGFVVSRWDALDQRAAVVEVSRMPEFALTKVEDPESGRRFERLVGLQPDDVLTLTSLLGKPRRGGWLARTADGMVVRVAPESITMLPIDEVGGGVAPRQRRQAVVTARVPWRNVTERRAQSLSAEELFGHAVPPNVLYAPGVCAIRPVKLDQPGNLHTVWLRLADQVLVRAVPESAFSVLPAGVGDPVEATCGPDGRWHLRATPQTVYVEALWKADPRPQPHHKDVYLCTTTVDGRRTDLFQATMNGEVRLRLVPAGKSRRHLEEAGLGRLLAKPHDAEAAVFGRGRAEVTLPSGATLHGETNGRDDGLPRQVTEVRVYGAPAEEPSGGRWWRLTRHIAVRTVPRDRKQHPAAEHEKRWREHLAKPDPHLVGALLKNDDQVRLSTLFVPTADGWRDAVPLDADRAPWVTGDYPRNELRVVLVDRERTWCASHAMVAPLSLDELVDDLRRRGTQIQPNPGELGVELRYAGRVGGEQPVHRFEWGYGWRAEIPEQLITVAGKPVGHSFPLFYGEIVRRAAFVRKAGRYELDLASFSIEHEVGAFTPARQIHFEATKGIVHRIEVEVSLSAGTAWVRVVHGRQERLSDDDRDDSQAVRLEHAELDEDTISWLLNRAAAEPDDSSHRYELLARLDHERATRDCGRTMRFARVTKLAKKQRLFMIAGDIVQRDNDVHLELHLPPNLEPFTGARSRARVNRRVFAHREGLLRSLHRKNPAALRGAVMLVEVMDDPEGERVWQGTTRIDLGRRLSHLFDYVEHHGGGCYAVLTKVRDQQVGLEFKPGAYFSVPFRKIRRNGRLEPGSIVRIAAGLGLFELFRAVRDDREYLPEPGRPAVALPKQPLLWSGTAVERASEQRMFTIGGLPGIQATADSPGFEGRDLMQFRHPKIVVARRTDHEVVLGKSDPARYPAGVVVVDRDGVQPLVRLRGRRRDDIPVKWGQLSFADAGAWRIAESFDQRGWSYHDRRTGFWPVIVGEKARFAEQSLADEQVTTARGVVFFTGKLALRYPEAELPRFGFSASDAVSELSDEFGPSPQDYVVAAPVADNGGLWVETFPGRVIELSADLLVAGPSDQYRPLRMVDWTRFAAGDKVRLSLHQPDDNQLQVSCVALHSWAPGPRGAFRGSRTLLPIDKADLGDMKLVLGHGRDRLDYPVSKADLPRSRRLPAVWLGQDNTLRYARANPELEPGDVVLLGRNRAGKWFVYGLGERTVEPAGLDETSWPDSEWLHAELTGAGGERLMSLLLNSMPVTVEKAGENQVVVSRRLQPAGRVRPGRWVRARVLGLLNEERVLLRTGASLLTVAVDRLVPGMPPAAATRVVAELAVDKRPKWFHADENGELRGGLPAGEEQTGADVQVEPLCVIGGDEGQHGVLCLQRDTASLRWLPARELGWVADLTATEQQELMARPGFKRLTARVNPDSTLSVVAARDMERRLSALRPGDTFRVTLEVERTGRNGVRRFIGCYYQANVIVEFETDDRKHQVGSAPVSVEIATVAASPDRHLIVVDNGRRRIPIDLPAELVRVIKKPEKYRLSRSAVDTQLLEAVPKGDRRLVADALHDWLREHEVEVFGEGEGRLDAAALVAAALAADFVAPAQGGGCAELAVWLAWQAGLRALRSWHVEAIADTWTEPGARLSAGEWQRLRPVAELIDVKILSADRNQIGAVCRGIISRSRVRHDPRLKAVAQALLAAIGESSPEQAGEATGSLPLLAPLGRALTPPRDRAVAQSRLLPAQRALLRQVFAALASLDNGIPLFPPVWTAPARRELAERVLADAVATLDATKTIDDGAAAMSNGPQEGERSERL